MLMLILRAPKADWPRRCRHQLRLRWSLWTASPPEEENLAPNLAPNPEPLSYKQGKRLWGKRAKAVKVKTVERLSAAAKAAEDRGG